MLDRTLSLQFTDTHVHKRRIDACNNAIMALVVGILESMLNTTTKVSYICSKKAAGPPSVFFFPVPKIPACHPCSFALINMHEYAWQSFKPFARFQLRYPVPNPG